MEEDFSHKGFFIFAKSQRFSLLNLFCFVCLRQVFFLVYPFSKHLKQIQSSGGKGIFCFIWPAKIKGHDILEEGSITSITLTTKTNWDVIFA